MLQVVGAERVQIHAQDVAETWQSCLQFICGEQLCRKIELERPFLIDIEPSKRVAADINQKEYKISICPGLAEEIGLPQLRGQFGQSKVYPLIDGRHRVRVKGCIGIIRFHQMCTEQLRINHPDWASSFRWPKGKCS